MEDPRLALMQEQEQKRREEQERRMMLLIGLNPDFDRSPEPVVMPVAPQLPPRLPENEGMIDFIPENRTSDFQMWSPTDIIAWTNAVIPPRYRQQAVEKLREHNCDGDIVVELIDDPEIGQKLDLDMLTHMHLSINAAHLVNVYNEEKYRRLQREYQEEMKKYEEHRRRPGGQGES